jgi:putative inorganic carbon (hco3(-)) transporter
LRGPASVQPGPALAFFLFILVNAILLIRPAEIFPQLEGIELYFYVIIACAFVAATDVMKYLSGTPIDMQPLTLALVLLSAVSLIAHLVGFNFPEAGKIGYHFLKNVIYFLLLVSIVTTPSRLRWFICWLLLIAAAVVTLAVLDYHGVVQMEAIRAVEDTERSKWGEVTRFERLQFSGLFRDPNDLCVWLAALLPLALYNVVQKRDLFRRLLGVALLLLFAYGIYLTRSRGGFLAMVTGLGVAIGMRYGRQRAALTAVVGLPLLLLMFAGRQTDIDANKGTGQSRVQIWSEWLSAFKQSPLVGVGVDLRDMDPSLGSEKEARAALSAKGQVAHNSYLQAFADTGFFGGCLFLGMVGVAMASLWRIARSGSVPFDPDTREVLPFLLGCVAAYGVGMLTLSLWFLAPTYVILGLAAAYPRIDRSMPPVPPIRFDVTLLGRFLLAGFAYMAVQYVFVRVFVNWG